MNRLIVVLALATCLSANAQSAKVIALSPQEAKTAQDLNRQQEEIAKKLKDFRESIRLKYLKAEKSDEGHTNTYSLNGEWVWVKSGWGSGDFEFSDDWKYIVPLKSAASLNPCGGAWSQSVGCITTSPLNLPGGGSLIAN